jgi:hypothetical protein
MGARHFCARGDDRRVARRGSKIRTSELENTRVGMRVGYYTVL